MTSSPVIPKSQRRCGSTRRSPTTRSKRSGPRTLRRLCRFLRTSDPKVIQQQLERHLSNQNAIITEFTDGTSWGNPRGWRMTNIHDFLICGRSQAKPYPDRESTESLTPPGSAAENQFRVELITDSGDNGFWLAKQCLACQQGLAPGRHDR